MIQTISLIILAAGSIGTLAGAWYVFKTLRANHDWNRRQYAADMTREWNRNTGARARSIEDVFPHIRDVDRSKGKVSELTRKRAREIYTCGPENEKYWNLRFQMIELLNYFDFIATAYLENVADNSVIDRSFKEPMSVWYGILRNFIDVVVECEGYQPWELYIKLMGEWRSPLVKRKPTA